MLRHTRGGFELRDIRKFTNVLEGHLTMLFTEHLGLDWLKVFFLEEGYHGDRSTNSRLLERSWGPGYPIVVTASPCRTLNPVLMHGGLRTMARSVPSGHGWRFLPIHECVLPVFLPELCQNVHGINTKVDHYGIGMGSREPTEVCETSGPSPFPWWSEGYTPSLT